VRLRRSVHGGCEGDFTRVGRMALRSPSGLYQSPVNSFARSGSPVGRKLNILHCPRRARIGSSQVSCARQQRFRAASVIQPEPCSPRGSAEPFPGVLHHRLVRLLGPGYSRWCAEWVNSHRVPLSRLKVGRPGSYGRRVLLGSKRSLTKRRRLSPDHSAHSPPGSGGSAAVQITKPRPRLLNAV